jgi:hypothetical protein
MSADADADIAGDGCATLIPVGRRFGRLGGEGQPHTGERAEGSPSAPTLGEGYAAPRAATGPAAATIRPPKITVYLDLPDGKRIWLSNAS